MGIEETGKRPTPGERLRKKFGNIPKWAEDFPLGSEQETSLSRRDLIRYLAVVSLGLFTGTFGIFLKSLQEKKKKFLKEAIRVTEDGVLAVGDSHIFSIPHSNEKGVLIRLSDDHYVAYSQKCTHLACPVLWDRGKNCLVCPCHRGAFSVQNGQPLFGPPKRPLTQFDVRKKGNAIYVLVAEERV